MNIWLHSYYDNNVLLAVGWVTFLIDFYLGPATIIVDLIDWLASASEESFFLIVTQYN